eukprot:CAMPEP_0197664200 /NCGR_PEP_ID=MMETSP1338-20131121/58490_1 /TAXON_ID=43686 ORGANISM="Pelagodinium beii, Strain RCC1491" /NCGR_SAMPLE_ID=MMETSP1338 /ASSEMBLY_ACC=CAM_ASM_000754 /LENGTH=144 /DNA_ID=CAMNT_0043242785 /DNA_START=176 /DNA_END=614 /DNA_ORIENTATION=+
MVRRARRYEALPIPQVPSLDVPEYSNSSMLSGFFAPFEGQATAWSKDLIWIDSAVKLERLLEECAAQLIFDKSRPAGAELGLFDDLGRGPAGAEDGLLCREAGRIVTSVPKSSSMAALGFSSVLQGQLQTDSSRQVLTAGERAD